MDTIYSMEGKMVYQRDNRRAILSQNGCTLYQHKIDGVWIAVGLQNRARPLIESIKKSLYK